MTAKEKVTAIGQQQLLRFEDSLEEGQKKALYEQIESLDFSVLENLSHVGGEAAKKNITPLKSMELTEINERKAEFEEVGVKAIQEGKVGAVLLAGGMGLTSTTVWPCNRPKARQ